MPRLNERIKADLCERETAWRADPDRVAMAKKAIRVSGFDATAVALVATLIDVARESRFAAIPSISHATAIIALLRVITQLNQEIHQ